MGVLGWPVGTATAGVGMASHGGDRACRGADPPSRGHEEQDRGHGSHSRWGRGDEVIASLPLSLHQSQASTGVLHRPVEGMMGKLDAAVRDVLAQPRLARLAMLVTKATEALDRPVGTTLDKHQPLVVEKAIAGAAKGP
ncbi:UNVERIFIED_CONTAM: hypothetical protein K2H54_058341 [Gekko kuhli]